MTVVIPAAITRRARLCGLVLAVAGVVLIAINGAWVATHLDLLRPMTAGDAAPAVVLPRIEAGGADGAPVSLDALRGNVIVLDFWATWCRPCLVSLPRLDVLQGKHGGRGLVVVAVNLDDAVAARALWDQRRWQMTLVRDAGGAADRYGVNAIPHQVVIDRAGVVRAVLRGESSGELAELVTELLDEPAP